METKLCNTILISQHLKKFSVNRIKREKYFPSKIMQKMRRETSSKPIPILFFKNALHEVHASG